MPSAWSHAYAQRTRTLTSSTIRELLKLTERPGVISFAGGLPAPDLFPLEAFLAACQRLLSETSTGRLALQYGPTEGYLPLREMIARHTARYGIRAEPENVLITGGSQQALDLIGKLLIDPGDRVLVEAPTYLGALQAFNVFGPAYTSVPIDQDGLQIGPLEAALRAGPKFMYLLPNFQNPAGVTLSLARRQAVVALAEKHAVPIVEDDPYGQLRYEGDHLPPLLVLNRERRGAPGANRFNGRVIYLSSFSKILAPGLRLGWVVAPPEVIGKLVQLKQGADLHTSTFTQMAAYEVARGGFLDSHIRRLRQAYRDRRDVMLASLAEHFPGEWGVTWTRPQGGLFVWARLPAGMDAKRLLEAALAENVAFVPGDSFFAPGTPADEAQRCLRLNFSYPSPELIQEGIRRLAAAVRAQLPVAGVPEPA